ncbi:phosphotransferase [Sporolactobacillus laevolacticus]|uniref:phosphotransferase n=1 Tax=Sporolactobacillus laevolacticus TaxID=33018 RepID=UPI0025B34658|nr:phosphotransferase [Sporolactobacillus laevolacticus]MDN3955859.1 phosphotransferase [Sporolactobacillus laevolacticus]
MANIWDPEQVVSEKLAKELVERQFPDLSPVTVTTLGEGYDNTVYLVNDCYVFRFPRRQIAVDLLNTEKGLLPKLAGTLPLQIAEPIYFGEPVEKVYPWPFMGYKLVRGNLPGVLTEEKRVESAVVLAKFLRALHDFPVDQAKALGVPPDMLGRLDIGKRKAALLERVDQMEALNLYGNVHNLRRYVGETGPVALSEQQCLVHGDMHIRNLIVDRHHVVTGVIDWGDVHIGDPAVDLSIIYSFLPKRGRDLFFEHYGRVDDSTKALAKWKAAFTTVSLIMYGHDMGNQEIVEACKQSLDLILED